MWCWERRNYYRTARQTGAFALLPLWLRLMTMNKYRVYELRIEESLPDHWSDWFEGLVIYHEPDGQTRLRGALPDQAALYGVLNKIHALHLTLVSVSRPSAGIDPADGQ